MLSFSEWKKENKIEESFDVNLGVSTPQSFKTFSSFSDLLEDKKKMKKKMDMDGGEMANHDDDHEDDDHHDDEHDDDHDDDDMDDHDDDHHDDDDHDDDHHDEEGEEGGDDMDGGKKLSPFAMRMKAKMKSKMKKKMSADDKKDDKKDKKEDKKDDKKKVKKESEEAATSNDWTKSLSNMIHDADPYKRHWDGLPTLGEDSVLPPIDPNTGLWATAEPEMGAAQPGDVGFSPSTRIGAPIGQFPLN